MVAGAFFFVAGAFAGLVAGLVAGLGVGLMTGLEMGHFCEGSRECSAQGMVSSGALEAHASTIYCQPLSCT